jgi:hypothetical protein
MTLKLTGVVVAAVAITSCVTANVLVVTLSAYRIPAVLNMLAIAVAAVATVLTVLAELHDRVDGRVTALRDLLVARLDELDSHAGDRNTGFVEGYLLSHGPDAAVVPFGPRGTGRRAMTGVDD